MKDVTFFGDHYVFYNWKPVFSETMMWQIFFDHEENSETGKARIMKRINEVKMQNI